MTFQKLEEIEEKLKREYVGIKNRYIKLKFIKLKSINFKNNIVISKYRIIFY